MKLSELFTPERKFYTKDEIQDFISQSKHYDVNSESRGDSESLMIFKTSQQQTWLVSSSKRLYCILDDIRNELPNLNWSVPRSKLVDNDKVGLVISTKNREAEYKNTGLVDIGAHHKNWLYTKTLFKDENIEEKIKQLIEKSMLKSEG